MRVWGRPVFKRRKPEEAISPMPASLENDAIATDAQKHGPDNADEIEQPNAPRAESAPKTASAGLGVPPFRSLPAREQLNMMRASLGSNAGPSAQSNIASALGVPAPPARQASPSAVPANSALQRSPSERRTLVVGRGISVQGTVQDAERLIVEGTVEASMIRATELVIAPTGVLKGEIEVEDAEIAGTIDGTLTARSALHVRGTGRVLGTARCRRLQVEDGGQITGRIEMITEQVPQPSTASPSLAPTLESRPIAEAVG